MNHWKSHLCEEDYIYLTFNLQDNFCPGNLYYFVTTHGNNIMLKFM